MTGARGYNPPEKLKVSLTYLDGYRGGNLYGFYGIDAVKKAKTFSVRHWTPSPHDITPDEARGSLARSTPLSGAGASVPA